MQLGAAQLGMNLEFSAAPFLWPPPVGIIKFWNHKMLSKSSTTVNKEQFATGMWPVPGTLQRDMPKNG